MSTHVGICITLIVGVCTEHTNNLSLTLEKENTELVIDMRLPEFYTHTKVLEVKTLEDKFGDKEAPHLKLAIAKKMSMMRESMESPFWFKARIPLGISVNPFIDENDWHLMGDVKQNRCIMLVLKTPTTGAYKGQGRKKVVNFLDE
jgi:hypothetical protein